MIESDRYLGTSSERISFGEDAGRNGGGVGQVGVEHGPVQAVGCERAAQFRRVGTIIGGSRIALFSSSFLLSFHFLSIPFLLSFLHFYCIYWPLTPPRS
jgi:hypothetical protein